MHHMRTQFSVSSRFGRLSVRAAVAAIFLVLCSSSFNGYFTYSGFREHSKFDSLQDVLAGTAFRPYVYRQLVPWITNRAVEVMPHSLIDSVVDHLRQRQANHPRPTGPVLFPDALLTAKFYFVFYLTFCSFVGAIYVLYRICWHCTGDRIASLGGAFIFALLLPLFMTDGGFFYDYWELLFFALAFWIALRGHPFWLPLLAIVATLNKESFVLFLPALIPILRTRYKWRVIALNIGAAILVSAILNFVVKAHFAGNPGGPVEWHWKGNLAFFAQPRSYLRFDFFYGILQPRGFNIINIFLFTAIVRYSWRSLAPEIRKSALIALAISVPLFVVFCYEDELRNFSMLYVTLAIMLATCLHKFLVSGMAHSSAPLSGQHPVLIQDPSASADSTAERELQHFA